MKGMQKIKRGSDFGGVVSYALTRKGKDHGALIGGNLSGFDSRTLTAEFRAVKKIRPDIEKPVWHNTLRLPNGEKLTTEQWQEVADDYMKKMGFSDEHQRVYVLHDDNAGQHIHIIANRISLSGSIYLGQNENLASTKIISELERSHRLTVTKGNDGKEQKARKRLKLKRDEQQMAKRQCEFPPRIKLQRFITTAAKNNPDIKTFVERLETDGVTVKQNIASTGRINGFSFELDGIAFKGSQLGAAFSWSNLKNNLELGLGLENQAGLNAKKAIDVYREKQSQDQPRIKDRRSTEKKY